MPRETSRILSVAVSTIAILSGGANGCNTGSVGPSGSVCRSSADCKNGWTCDNGICAKLCNADSDCPSTDYVCTLGVCRFVPDDSCAGETPGTVRLRTRYASESVPFGDACQAETQTSVCVDERWSAWSGTFAFESCVVLPRQDCGTVIDGTREIRNCYDAPTVPIDGTCTFIEQTRQCRSGSFNPDWPACEYTTCSVIGYASCGDTPHGNSESRRCWADAVVPPDATCSWVEQVRTCNNGFWDPDYPPCDNLSCVVGSFASCGTMPHGTVESCGCYTTASVPYGSSCTFTAEERTCNDGVWDPGCPLCANPTCVVESPASCDGHPHLFVEHRTRFQAETVSSYATCVAEDQTRTCTNGIWSEWTGTYLYASCVVSSAWPTGLVSWWRLDESTGTAIDSVGTNHGTVAGATQNQPGKANTACSFDGDAGDRITLPDVTALQMADGSFTFAAWIRPTAYDNQDAGWCSVIGGETGAASFGLQTDGSLRLTSVNVEDAPNSTLVPPLNRWSFVAVSFDSTRTTNNLIYFLDTAAQTVTFDRNFAAAAASCLLGTRTTTEKSFMGTIDEVMFWNRALSPIELYTVFRSLDAPPIEGLAGYWPFDEPTSASVASDLSGNGNDGTLTNGPTWGMHAGQVGGALEFDGTDDYVAVLDDPSLDMTAELTISTWVYLPAEPDHRMVLVDKGYVYEYCLQIRNDPQIIHTYSYNGDEGIIVNQAWSGWLNRWMHLAWTFSGVHEAIWVNGARVGTYDKPHAGTLAGTGVLNFARRTDGSEYFHGFLDEVRIYHRALGASEVARLAGQQNLLANPSFESYEVSTTGGCSAGLWRWIFCLVNGAIGSYETVTPGFEDNQAARIEISTTSDNMQLYQYNFNLQPSTRYRLSFVGYSSTGHDVRVALIKHTADYNLYGLNQVFDLGTSWQPFSTVFWTPSSVPNPRLHFWFAGHASAGDIYYLDNVELRPYP